MRLNSVSAALGKMNWLDFKVNVVKIYLGPICHRMLSDDNLNGIGCDNVILQFWESSRSMVKVTSKPYVVKSIETDSCLSNSVYVEYF